MPFSIFKNPFSEPKKRKTDDAELVGALLGPEEEAEMREAMGDQPIEEELKGDDTIRLTKEEEAAKKKVEEEVTPEGRRREYIEWSKELGKNKQEINGFLTTLTFNEDGSVDIEGDLRLSGENMRQLPGGLRIVKGDVEINHCTELKSLEHLPSSIGGHLDLRGCTLIKDIPEGIKIGKRIFIDKTQTEFRANAETKGYALWIRI